MTTAKQIADEIVVFFNPDGSPFSNDPRWNDSRVREAWEAKQGAEVDEEIEEEDLDPEDEEEVPYTEWTNDELRAELVKRKLSLDGKKADLIARLEEDDAKAEA